MILLGGTVAIIEEGRVLLTKREDFEVWCLPGGQTEVGESVAETAMREAKEETGLDIELTTFVGMYARIGSHADTHIALFSAHRINDTLTPQVDEVIDIDWFDPAALPDEMFWWHRPMVTDAFNGVGGSSIQRLHIEVPEPVSSRQELYDLRDRSGLSRSEFYRYYFEQTQNQKRIL